MTNVALAGRKKVFYSDTNNFLKRILQIATSFDKLANSGVVAKDKRYFFSHLNGTSLRKP